MSVIQYPDGEFLFHGKVDHHRPELHRLRRFYCWNTPGGIKSAAYNYSALHCQRRCDEIGAGYGNCTEIFYT